MNADQDKKDMPHFTTWDLLIATFLAAIYCEMATAGLFGTLEGLVQMIIPGVVLLTVALFLGLTVTRRMPNDAGALLCRLRPKLGWPLHFWLAAFLLVCGSLFQLVEDGSLPANLLPFILLQSYVYALCMRVAVHERGVVMGTKVFDFRTYRFVIRPQAGGAELIVDRRWLDWFVPASKAFIPEECVRRVEIILAEKQPP